MGGAAAGAMDANAFNAAVRSAHDGVFLPEVSTLTYQGVFNEHSYHTGGPEDTHQVAVAAYAARGLGSLGDPDEVWVACFLKSCRDGQPRDHIAMDLIVVLDVSGSMDWSVDSERLRTTENSRLALAQEALTSLIPKLRPDDRFGLATFTNEGRVIQPLVPVAELRHEELLQQIHELRAGGGTTISAGLQAAVQISGEEMPVGRHRRLLFLTDMDDMRPGQLDHMVATQSERGLFVSFVGIGMGFKAELAEQVSKHKGSNYFCITQEHELRKTIVDNFDWNFFPAAFNVEMTEQSDTLQLSSVYGTPYDLRDELVEAEWTPDVHRFYPEEFKYLSSLYSENSQWIAYACPTVHLQLPFRGSAQRHPCGYRLSKRRPKRRCGGWWANSVEAPWPRRWPSAVDTSLRGCWPVFHQLSRCTDTQRCRICAGCIGNTERSFPSALCGGLQSVPDVTRSCSQPFSRI